MSGLRSVRYRDLVQRLRSHGFIFDRTAKGSHEICTIRKPKKRTTVPHHPGDIPKGTLRAIISQTGLSPNEFFNDFQKQS
ncbi:MAG TPA: type II toxin-antitoxin system HicA family toxin [Verrucomicrobiae bacterium]|jgi:predicted RNA binding protein YcfA (HicA-like mRNA interferase family)